jgi:hypothetical protein
MASKTLKTAASLGIVGSILGFIITILGGIALGLFGAEVTQLMTIKFYSSFAFSFLGMIGSAALVIKEDKPYVWGMFLMVISGIAIIACTNGAGIISAAFFIWGAVLASKELQK